MIKFLNAFPNNKGKFDEHEKLFFFNASCEESFPDILGSLYPESGYLSACKSFATNDRLSLIGLL